MVSSVEPESEEQFYANAVMLKPSAVSSQSSKAVVDFNNLSSWGNDSVDEAKIGVRLNKRFKNDLTIRYGVLNKESKQDPDWLDIGLLTFTAGEVSKELAVPIQIFDLNRVEQTVTIVLLDTWNSVSGEIDEHLYTLIPRKLRLGPVSNFYYTLANSTPRDFNTSRNPASIRTLWDSSNRLNQMVRSIGNRSGRILF